jgi:hypothetical protein
LSFYSSLASNVFYREGVIKLDAVVNDLVITNLATFDPRVVHADLSVLSMELALFIPMLRVIKNNENLKDI